MILVSESVSTKIDGAEPLTKYGTSKSSLMQVFKIGCVLNISSNASIIS